MSKVLRRRASGTLRKSSNGRRAVSKTVNVGSIPAFRAKRSVTPSPQKCKKKIASDSTLAHARAGLLARNKDIKKSTDMAFVENVKESYNELVHKVSWPTRKELAQSAVIVLIASIILALIVWLMDWCFESIMTFVYGLF